jgi:RimJ/RimL family protein N-acetyltransferase
MQILESTNVDLLSPFPPAEAKRIFGWMHAYKSVVETDQSPKTPEEFADYFNNLLPNLKSFAVIDKFNALGMKHEAPLIGMIAFEPQLPWQGCVHVASTRKAWGSGLFEEGARVAIESLFVDNPNLLTINSVILRCNYPVSAFLRKLGFKVDGVLEGMASRNGEPMDLMVTNLNRRRFLDGLAK